ncbi:MAG TPA: ThuA domain-containing protein [Abditibacteriaceae bacterium]|jgi:type 1 glutamine amidotransferase
MKPISTLLVTGANNHDWQRTAPYLQGLLTDSGRFSVTLATDASLALEGDLNGYDLFLLDYNGDSWSEKAQNNFLEAVRNGAGVVIFHAANNSFEGWTEYEKLVGLLWREGTGHGQFHTFNVDISNSAHPITQGVTNFETEDELYHRLVPMHGTEVEILATAYSDPEQGGTGDHEPVLMTTQYGAGRVFHTALGHVWEGDPNCGYRGCTMVALENKGFQTTLLRGSEWAATGIVQ